MLNLSEITLTWDLIFKVYVITALTVNILSFPMIVLLYKRQPSFLKKIDSAIDRFIEGKKGTKDEGKKKDEGTEEKPDEGLKGKSVEEMNELNGIANIVLYIGDSYKCMLNEFERKSLLNGGGMWTSSDEFVGCFEKGNLFTAKKVGTTFLSYNGIRLYYIEVRSMNAGWRLQPYVEIIMKRPLLDTVKYQFRKEKITAYSIDAKDGEVLSYRPGGGKDTITVHAGTNKTVDRIVISSAQEDIDRIRKEFSEFFEPTEEKVPKDGVQYWYHKWSDENENGKDTGIDMVAFLRKSGQGGVTLGICRSWRKTAEVEEIAQNPEMILRQFFRMLPSGEFPETVRPSKDEAPKEMNDSKKDIPLKNDRSGEKETAGETPAEQTMPEKETQKQTQEQEITKQEETVNTRQTEEEQPTETETGETDIEEPVVEQEDDITDGEDEPEEGEWTENEEYLESTTDDPTELGAISPTDQTID